MQIRVFQISCKKLCGFSGYKVWETTCMRNWNWFKNYFDFYFVWEMLYGFRDYTSTEMTWKQNYSYSMYNFHKIF